MRRLLVALVLLAGCDLYWNNGDDECKYDYGDDVAVPEANYLRNPDTGRCEPFGGGYPYGCDNPCEPCPAAGEGDGGGPALAPWPDWGACYSQCNNLDETSCIAAPGCLATYNDYNQHPAFAGCFATAPVAGGAPPTGGSCIGLDAQSCSERDTCSMYYVGSDEVVAPPAYERCVPESNAMGCGSVDCGMNYHCEDQCDAAGACNPMCVPDGDVCAAVDCGPGYQCVETCVPANPTHVGQCYGTCEMESACSTLGSEAECTARQDCTTVYDGEDCTCYPDTGCTCQTLTYDHCETRN